jgi:uncharacterized protein (DUF1697 family)
MALIVLLRGINVGGHRAFRPTLLAQELEAFDVVNIGATGTFVVRAPGSRASLRAALQSRLPATTRFVFCEGRDLLQLAMKTPFIEPPPNPSLIRFVSFLDGVSRAPLSLPFTIPQGRDWFVRVTTVTKRLAVGEYRRHMKTIRYLGQLDTIFGTLVTTRSWTTVNAIVQTLEASGRANQRKRSR